MCIYSQIIIHRAYIINMSFTNCMYTKSRCKFRPVKALPHTLDLYSLHFPTECKMTSQVLCCKCNYSPTHVTSFMNVPQPLQCYLVTKRKCKRFWSLFIWNAFQVKSWKLSNLSSLKSNIILQVQPSRWFF